jgi:hypothetical protein
MIRGLMADDEWAYFGPSVIHRSGGHRHAIIAAFVRQRR